MAAPTGLIEPNPNVFDKAFSEGLCLEEWDKWMRWEVTTARGLVPGSIERNDSMDSNPTSSDPWAMGMETSGVDMLSTSYSAGSDFTFADAPYEYDDTPPTSASSSNKDSPALYRTTGNHTTQGQIQQELRRSQRGFTSLTPAEEQTLQNIAMPHHASTHTITVAAPDSPAETLASQTLSPSPEQELPTRKNNKRKTVSKGEPPSAAICQSRKRGHNAIEKRYRTNLNSRIESLREGIPALCEPDENGGEENSEGEGDANSSQQKYGKAAILMRALDYIKYLEMTTQRLGGENDTLTTRIGAFEKLAMSGSIMSNAGGMEAMSRPTLAKSETLESIQSEFQQIRPKPKAPTGSALKRKSSRQAKAS